MEADVSEPLKAHRFVGRSAEVERLRLLLDAGLSEGVARVAVIEGPPGIGKTRFLDEALEPSRGRYFVITVHHSETVRGPYLGIQLGFERAAASAPAELEPVVRTIAEGLGAGPQLEKPARFAAVARGLLRIAGTRRVILVVDDVQWADTATIDLVRFLHLELAHEPLVIALLNRTVTDDGLLESFPDAVTFRLRPLSAESMLRLVRSAPAAHRLSDDECAEITRLAEGNPFFALELARHRRAGQGAFPRSIAAPIERQVRTLDPAARRILTIAAVADDLHAGVLGAASGQPHEIVAAALADAQAAGLLECEDGVWRFRHALVRETVAAVPGAADLRRIHQALAEQLERVPHPSAARLAHHWLLAGDRERAARWSAAAGTLAAEVGAHYDAIPHLSRALELDPGSGADRARLSELIGFSLLVLGRFGEAADAFDRAMELYVAAGDDAGVIRVSLNRSRLFFSQADMDRTHAAANAAVALVELGEPSSLGFRAWSHVAQNHLYGEAYAQARSALTEGLRHRDFAAAADLPAFEFVTARVALHFGELDAFREHARRAIAAADQAGRLEIRSAVLHNLGVPAGYAGLTAEGRELLVRSLEVSARYGLHYNAAMTQLDLARLDWLEAKLPAAVSNLRECFANASRFAYTKLWIFAHGIPIALAAADADLLVRSEAAASFEAALESKHDGIIAGVATALAQMKYGAGAYDEAREILSRAFGALRGAGLPPLFGTWLAIAGRPDDYAPALERLRESRGLAADADRAQLQAAAARRRGRLRIAHAAALAAADAYARLGWPLWRAHALHAANRPREAAGIVSATGAAVWFDTAERGARARLTPRERDVVERAASGKSNRQIAAELDLSPRTVENYLQSVFSRLNITSRADLPAALQRDTH